MRVLVPTAVFTLTLPWLLRWMRTAMRPARSSQPGSRLYGALVGDDAPRR